MCTHVWQTLSSICGVVLDRTCVRPTVSNFGDTAGGHPATTESDQTLQHASRASVKASPAAPVMVGLDNSVCIVMEQHRQIEAPPPLRLS